MGFRSDQRRMLAVLILVGAWLAAASAGSAAAGPTVSPAPVLDFTFDQFPAPGKGEKATRVLFACGADGQYRATRQDLPDGADPVTVASQDGTLGAEELQQLLGAARDLDWASLGDSTQNLGFGSAVAPGWKGSFAFQEGGAARRVQFTSLRSATQGERSVAVNRLVTFVFDLKNLALAKLGMTPVRQSPENAPSQ